MFQKGKVHQSLIKSVCESHKNDLPVGTLAGFIKLPQMLRLIDDKKNKVEGEGSLGLCHFNFNFYVLRGRPLGYEIYMLTKTKKKAVEEEVSLGLHKISIYSIPVYLQGALLQAQGLGLGFNVLLFLFSLFFVFFSIQVNPSDFKFVFKSCFHTGQMC